MTCFLLRHCVKHSYDWYILYCPRPHPPTLVLSWHWNTKQAQWGSFLTRHPKLPGSWLLWMSLVTWCGRHSNSTVCERGSQTAPSSSADPHWTQDVDTHRETIWLGAKLCTCPTPVLTDRTFVPVSFPTGRDLLISATTQGNMVMVVRWWTGREPISFSLYVSPSSSSFFSPRSTNLLPHDLALSLITERGVSWHFMEVERFENDGLEWRFEVSFTGRFLDSSCLSFTSK